MIDGIKAQTYTRAGVQHIDDSEDESPETNPELWRHIATVRDKFLVDAYNREENDSQHHKPLDLGSTELSGENGYFYRILKVCVVAKIAKKPKRKAKKNDAMATKRTKHTHADSPMVIEESTTTEDPPPTTAATADELTFEGSDGKDVVEAPAAAFSLTNHGDTDSRAEAVAADRNPFIKYFYPICTAICQVFEDNIAGEGSVIELALTPKYQLWSFVEL